jgi:hypothetical protein
MGLLLLGAVLLLTAPTAHAQWKWRDKNGRVTASDLPPPRDIPDKDVLQRPGSPAGRVPPAAETAAAPAASAPVAGAAASAVAIATPPAAETELDKRIKAAEQEKAAKAKAEERKVAAQRADNCSRARTQLATLESGQRLARVNTKGEREYLDDQTRASEASRARELIASNCR